MTRFFLDTEFTGLRQDTTLISIGIVSEDGTTFYAELTDYDKTQINQWLLDNVIPHLKYNASRHRYREARPNIHDRHNLSMCDNMEGVSTQLLMWLSQYEGPYKFVVDVGQYDWVLFNELCANRQIGYSVANDARDKIDYIPTEFSTLLEAAGMDPDMDRSNYAKTLSTVAEESHNALSDAKVLAECYKKLTS